MAGYVYLIWAKGTDCYKIGSSQYPEKRLPSLQTGSPVELEIIAVMPSENHELEERAMHARWRSYRIQGEWFKFNPTLIPRVLGDFGFVDDWTKDLADSIVSMAASAAVSEFSTVAVAIQVELMKAMQLTSRSRRQLAEIRLIVGQVGITKELVCGKDHG